MRLWLTALFIAWPLFAQDGPRDLLPKSSLRLDASTPRFTTIPLDIDRKTDRIEVRIKRPTTADPAPSWDGQSVIRTAIVVSLSGIEYRASASVVGGVRERSRGGPEQTHSYLIYTLPWGFFGARDKTKRLGERDAGAFRVWIEVERVSGDIDTEIEAAFTVSDAPDIPFHSSVAFDAASSVLVSDDADGTLTVSHTASGSDRAAFVGVAHLAQFGQQQQNATASYGGSSMTQEWFENNSRLLGCGFQLAGDANIPTGAQTVSVTVMAGNHDDFAIGVISMTGVDPTTPVGTPALATGSSTTPSVTVGSVGADDMVVDNLVHDFSGGHAAGANQTQRYTEQNAYAVAMAGSTQSGADGGVMSWTLSGTSERDPWGIGAIAFKPNTSAPVQGAASLTASAPLSGTGEEILVGSSPLSSALSVSGAGEEIVVGAPSVTPSLSMSGTGEEVLVGSTMLSAALTVSVEASAGVVSGAASLSSTLTYLGEPSPETVPVVIRSGQVGIGVAGGP